MAREREATFLLVAMLFVVIPAGAFQNPPEAVLDMEPEPRDRILAGVPVVLSAEYSYDVFEFEHIIELRDNGNLISMEESVVYPFKEGDHNVSLYVKTEYGSDIVWMRFHVYRNPPPEIEGTMKYYDPFNNYEAKSNKKLSVPLFGSVSIVVWNKEDAERDDETSYSASVSQTGLEVAKIEDDGDNTSFSLFASEAGTYNVLVTGRDEAGQESSANFVVNVQCSKALEIDMTPDNVSEEVDIKLRLKHPCQDDICDYKTSIKDMERGGTVTVEEAEFIWYFDDEGPYIVTTNVTYNGTIITSHSIDLFVADTVDDPPSIIINVTTPAFVGEPVNIILEAYDDGHEVEVIDAEIHGDYEDETRYTTGRVVGDSGTITFTPRKTGSYHVTAKTCDKMECNEITLYFDVLENTTKKVDEQEDKKEEKLPDEETQDQGNDKKTPGFRGLTVIMAVLIIHVKMRRY